MNSLFVICTVFIGCCTNVIFLEYIIKAFPGSGNIVTFAQFLFIAIEGLIFTNKFGNVKPVIPLKVYAIMVFLFFMVSVVNNYALNFNISMPLHMIFRSGSLIANLILGVFILKKKYPVSKYISIVMISAGIVAATLASGSMKDNGDAEDGLQEYASCFVGIALLTFALFMSAYMGIYQEQTYRDYGKHPMEALFYNHALPLPLFLFLSSDIYKHGELFNTSQPVGFPVVGLVVPIMWLYLLGNVLTQYMCIKSVFILTTECPSLVVTLVITLRKFASLLFSIWYFQNPFTTLHWVGTGLVFIGTILFTGVLFPDSKTKTQ